MSKHRVRGFEKISIEQWGKDVGEYADQSIQFVWHDIVLPKRATSHSSGYDIFAVHGFTLNHKEEIKLPTGWKSYMQPSEWLLIMPRSGLGFKYYTRLANTIGNGDSDYYNNSGNEGHYWVKIRNEGYKPLSIKQGDAIAQCVFLPYLLADDDSFKGKERIGGIGSTNE